MKIEPPILVTGCARSGTSMTAGILHLCGAWGGEMFGANPSNPRGMYENIQIRQNIVKPYLRKIGADPLGQDPLPEMNRVFETRYEVGEKMRRDFTKVLRMEKYPGGSWFYKGAKMCLIWPVLHEAFPEAKWVVVRRMDADIVNSCMKTGFMRAFKHEAGWFGWVDVHKNRFKQMEKAELNIHYVWPQKVVLGSYDEIQKVVKELGLSWNSRKISSFVAPALWSRAEKRRMRHGASDKQ